MQRKLAGVLVVHENRGLNPYIEDVARRVATANFLAFAPDGLDECRGISRKRRKGRATVPRSRSREDAEDFVAAARWLKSRPDCTGKMGVVGFCFGGGVANNWQCGWAPISRPPCLSTAVNLRGDAAKIKAPLMFHYACLDTSITGNWPAYEEALKANHVQLRRTCTRVRTTDFITTRRPDTTKLRQNSPGSAPSTSSTNI